MPGRPEHPYHAENLWLADSLRIAWKSVVMLPDDAQETVPQTVELILF